MKIKSNQHLYHSFRHFYTLDYDPDGRRRKKNEKKEYEIEPTDKHIFFISENSKKKSINIKLIEYLEKLTSKMQFVHSILQLFSSA